LAVTGPVAWGENHYGQLGDGKSGVANDSDVPVALSGVGEVVALAGGSSHSLALLANGTVLSWGYNGQGQLGDGKSCTEQCESDVPVAVSGLTEVTAIAAGGDFSLALLKNGTVMSWGNNEVGRLGDGKSGSEFDTDVPVQVSGLTEVTAISAGDAHSLALLKNGTVMSWGLNSEGQLGDGLSGFENDSDVPVPVSGLSGVASVAAGGLHSLAVLSSGAVMTWGSNSDGQLGTGSSTGPETCLSTIPCAKKPVAVSGVTEASAAAGGKYFSLALQKSGAVVAWGNNQTGELGDGVTEGPERCSGNVECSTKAVPVSGLTEAVAISAGDRFALARLKAGGVVAWGENAEGELGDGTTSGSGCYCSTTPVHVDGLSGTTALFAGGFHALALGTLAPIPTITSVEPNNGPAPGGTGVTIIGTNLSEVTAVKFGSTSATSFKVESETKISAVSPSGVGVVDVTVATANATSPITSADHFDYAPTVTHVEPNDGPAAGGTSVTITGTNFNEVSAVKFGSANATSFKVESVGKIAAVAPAGTGSVDVTVTSTGGTSPTGASDLFDYAPTVTKIEPNDGTTAGGTSVTITGTNFNEVSAVKFGSNTAASVTVNSPTSITARSPAGSGTVDVTVTTAGGTSPTSEADSFIYGPKVTAVSPGYGSPGGGTSVTITGTAFTGATAVKFGSANATSFKVESATSITAVSPSGTGTVGITVTTPEGTSVTNEAFDYGPTVSRVVPGDGANAGGTSVEIIGTNFNEVEAVKFGSTSVSFTRNSETSITAVSPPFTGGSARVRVTVTTKGGVNPERGSTILTEEYFGYAPTVSSVAPKSGPAAGGTSVRIEGTAFESIRKSDEFPPFVASVKFGSTNATSFTVNSEGSVTAVAPAGTGTVDVTVETYAGTSLTSSADRYTFIPSAPSVETNAASSVTQTTATLNASVNPNGGEVSGCKFEYGTTIAYGSSAPCTSLPGSGESPVAVSASVSGLSPNTTYHFRVSATNALGTSKGSDQTFATLPLSGPTFATSFTPEKSEGSFNEPDAVALDPSGNIWVADSGHDRVLEFNKERKFIRQFGVEGTGGGQYEGIAMSGIAGIATNSAGDVYVTGSDRVQEFSPTGEFLRQWGSPGSGNGQFLFPYGIAVDSSGNVWVLDTFNYRVQEFSESGAYLGQFGSQGSGNGQFGWAHGLAFSGGNLYVADSGRVQEFSTAGTYLAQFGSSGTGNGQFHGLGGIATDPTTGDLYVSDTYNNRVQVFSSAGSFLAAFGSGGSGSGQFSAPRGVAVNSSGTAYVADTGNNRVQEWVGGP
jgi:alpha-tubulin suppressor-like RCC1 family protein